MRMRSLQASRSVRPYQDYRVYFLGRKAIDSFSQVTHMEGHAEHRSVFVEGEEVDDENRVELGCTRRRQSRVVLFDLPTTCTCTCSGTNI